jgi:hypothetical protein
LRINFNNLLLLFLLIGTALGGEWQVDVSAKNEVMFISRAETFLKNFEFEGLTDKIDGYIYWKDDSLFANNQFYFELQVGTFKTGIDKRDQDMRSMVLETDQWPVSSYKGTITLYEKIDTTVTAYRFSSQGTLILHGAEKTISVPGMITFDDKRLQVTAQFAVLLTDYQMEIPSILVAKVANEIQLKMKFYMKNVE